MAPRLSRRQLREKDELLNLSGSLSQDLEDEQHLNSIQDENSSEQTATKERAVGFAAVSFFVYTQKSDSAVQKLITLKLVASSPG